VDATFIFMMLALKIPIVALICLVWWAVKQEPEPEPSSSGGDGGTKVPPHPRHPRRPLPRHPRRGPHGGSVTHPPPRVRSVVARARQTHGGHV
jgi:hypothetical protein